MLAWLCFALWLVPGILSENPQVLLKQGRLEGIYTRTVNGREFSAFWGIPYGKPPIGKYRFKEAEPADPWKGVLSAKHRPPRCLQYSHFYYKSSTPILGQEDCLFLNVFTPKVEEGANMDVIVYIHGGAFMFGGSSNFGPDFLLDRDIVLVTINYRLGPLGFLSTGDSVVPGNNGLKDQVLALKWVKSNIRSFGGNPDRVTLGGLSAGGASVHYHILSPLSKGLFHRAIILSGTALNPWSLVDRVQQKSRIIASTLGCPTNDSSLMVTCLRNHQPENIVILSKLFQGYLFNPFSPFGPIVEVDSPNAFLSADPGSIILKGRAQDVPILASYTSEDGLYPGAELLGIDENLAHLRQHLRAELPHILDYNWTLPAERRKEVAERILRHYQVDLNTEQGEHNFIKVLSDRLFIQGIVKAARLHAAHSTSPVYLFRFSYRGSSSVTSFWTNKNYGVSHADDQMYIMSISLVNTTMGEQEKKVSRFLIDLWMNFIKNGSLSQPWTSLKEGKMYQVRGPDKVEVYQNPDPGQVGFWDSLDLDNLPATPQRKDDL